jgi:hypothetical protein
MSIENHYFQTASGAFKFLDKLALEKNDFIFRGHKQKDYKLETTLQRHRLIPHSHGLDIDEMINHFRVGLTRLGIAPFQSDSRLDWLEYARHHGVPTPVLDFTYSPYIALFFAFNGVKKKYGLKAKEYSVICALRISGLAHLWAKLSLNPSPGNDEYQKRYHEFLYPQEDPFHDGFPVPYLQFLPFPGKFNTRMHRQQGCLLFDTLQYQALRVANLDKLIEMHREPDTHNPDGKIEKGEPILRKIFINKKCVSDIFAKLELMGISGGGLYMNADGVAQDVVNEYNYISKTSYLRDMRFTPPDDGPF